MRFESHGELRPTAAKVREALMNILRERLPGASFLDLYAGVGSVGIEAHALGAGRVVLVEKDPKAMRVLRENAQGLPVEPRQRPALAALKELAGQQFDVIFMDPPYGKGDVPRTLQGLVEGRLLAPGGLVVAEHHHKDETPEQVGPLRRHRVQRYGETALSFYEEVGDGQ
ncbi:MAG: 16S rRNA (guanine(966)-N(2))-methyltransferase RsmD [Candidatus Xenobia bacterium]